MTKSPHTMNGAPGGHLAFNRRAVLEERFPTWTRHTLASHFSEACEQYKDRPFIHISGATTTYGEIWENARQYAKAFVKIGINRRDHIAILMENDKSYPSLMIAASLVGAVFIPINTMLGEEELEYILNQSDARFLILHDRINDKQHGDTVGRLLDTPRFQVESQLQHVICIPTEMEQIDQRFLSWDDFCLGATSVTDEELHHKSRKSHYPDEVVAIIYTSGSTGEPKGVMQTHDMLLRSSYSTCVSRAIEDGRVTFAPLPFYHCFAITEAIIAMSFVGGSVISSSTFTPLSALQMMERYQANDLLCVPSMLVPLLNHPRVSEFDLSNLYAMWCGAAPAPVYIWNQAVDVLGLTEACTGYGQTEVTSSGVITEMDDPVELISTRVGRPKLGGVAGLPEFNGSTVQYKTIDQETGNDLPNGSIGELVVRGNTVTNGYYNKPIETAQTIDKDGWLRTGDVGIIDENEYIEILGRSNDLYKVSGETVAPREVETVIAQHPAVNQVFIIGVADPMTTEAGAAFIELTSGSSCSRRDITDWCSSRLARFKIPRHVWFIESTEWPMTSTGKVQNFRLKEMAQDKLAKRKG
ncbi:MAG TPA: class I adenylate-forming enzyme family protein [Virgibacillus sp.]|nr:class I adenylate-forming enzyme family protein [Virgibacillus sp.]